MKRQNATESQEGKLTIELTTPMEIQLFELPVLDLRYIYD